MSGKVFISYSHSDSIYANELSNALTNEGFEVWIDNRIDIGGIWPQVIGQEVDNCGALIVIMSPSAHNSLWIQNELVRAQRKKRPIFPLLLEGDEPWIGTEAIQYLDVRGAKLPPPLFYDILARYSVRKIKEKSPIEIPEGDIFDNIVDSNNLALAISEQKLLLLNNIKLGVKYEVDSIEALQSLTINLIDDNDRVVKSFEAKPSVEYSRVLYKYLRGKKVNGYRVDSYVTPRVCQRTNNVFIDFYTSREIQQVVIKDITLQLFRFKEYVNKLKEVGDKNSISDEIDIIIKSDLYSVIREVIMKQSFEESILEVLQQAVADSVIKTAVAYALVQSLSAMLGASISSSWVLPFAVAIIIIQILTFKEKLANKVSQKLSDAVSIDLFPNINIKIAKKMTDEITKEILSRINKDRNNLSGQKI